jgi:hypothetical protein
VGPEHQAERASAAHEPEAVVEPAAVVPVLSLGGIAALPADLRALAVGRLSRGAGNRAIAREVAPPSAPPSGVVVEDTVEDPAPTQMKRSPFLAQLRASVTTAAEGALSGSAAGALARPKVQSALEERFQALSGQDAAGIERTLRAEVGGGPSATALIASAASATAEAVTAQLPKEEKSPIEQATNVVGGMAEAVGNVVSGVVSLLFKRRDGVSGEAATSEAVRGRLGAGRVLSPAVRAPVEAALGEDFSDVRIHTGGEAARAADDQHARAFTMGRDIAFGAGEYAPGTPTGDALLAHELAHVAQQRGGGAVASEAALEADADQAAAAVLVGRPSLARLRSGLSLQRCGKDKPPVQADQLGKRVVQGMTDANGGNPSGGIWYWPNYKTNAENKVPGFEWNENRRTGYTKAPNWRKQDAFRWSWTGGGKPSDALRGWLGGLTIADCASVAVALHYQAILDQVGDEKFDNYFNRKGHLLVIDQYPKDVALGKFMIETGKAELKQGDWYYFANHPDFPRKHPRGLWQGENSLYLGDGKWQGFGSDELTEKEMLEKLLVEYNAERDDEDLKFIDSKKGSDGEVPSKYKLKSQGGDVKDTLGDTNEIVAAGGGLQATGSRLDPKAVTQLRDEGTVK